MHTLSTRAPRAAAARRASSSSGGKSTSRWTAGDRDQVGLGQPVEAVLHLQVEPGLDADRAGRLRAEREVEAGQQRVVGALGAEHLAQHPELEQGDLVQDRDGDVADHARQYGRKLCLVVNPATGGGMCPNGELLP